MQIAPAVARAGELSSQLLDLRTEGGPPVLEARHLREEGGVAGRGIRASRSLVAAASASARRRSSRPVLNIASDLVPGLPPGGGCLLRGLLVDVPCVRGGALLDGQRLREPRLGLGAGLGARLLGPVDEPTGGGGHLLGRAAAWAIRPVALASA